MKPVPYLPTLEPKALAALKTTSSVYPTNIDGIPYDQTYLRFHGGRWEVYRNEKYPRLVGFSNTIFTAVYKARVAMPWFKR